MNAYAIQPAQLRRMLDDGGEIALLDVREEGVFARDGHILLASNVPLSHLELMVGALLPRKTVRIVVCDGGEGLASTAAARLITLGYRHVEQLEGGASAWKAAGERLYTGVYVPSKAFGEYVLHEDKPPEVTADELHAWKRDGRDMVILDSRPIDEYRRNSIPGAIDCPSAELVYRTHDLLRSPDTTVVVNCGGRTRSIIGAQALINAGLKNPVFALKDGTQGWHLAGYTLDHGRTDEAPMPSAAGAARSREDAVRVARRFGVRTISAAQLKALLEDSKRTVYLIDVRSPEEYPAGHVSGSRSVPGGQLIQATDVYLAVRHAAVVLIDDNGARATTTAAWLIQMGWRDVFVLENALALDDLVRAAETVEVPGLDDIEVKTICAASLDTLIGDEQIAVVDLANSLRYSEGHIPGAWHVVRSRLRENLEVVPKVQRLIFTSPDNDALSKLAARDAMQLTSASVEVLAGGTKAWMAAGYPLERGTARYSGPDDDIKYKALDRKADVEAAIREYLEWEIDLVNATASDPDFGFQRFA
ncbi:MAG TPA: rhodanese-like domain-containing protein [Burkholderiales bacterium]|nr:rhodanese-like domain-containing protein [Burkholderiales bacterium]